MNMMGGWKRKKGRGGREGREGREEKRGKDPNKTNGNAFNTAAFAIL